MGPLRAADGLLLLVAAVSATSTNAAAQAPADVEFGRLLVAVEPVQGSEGRADKEVEQVRPHHSRIWQQFLRFEHKRELQRRRRHEAQLAVHSAVRRQQGLQDWRPDEEWRPEPRVQEEDPFQEAVLTPRTKPKEPEPIEEAETVLLPRTKEGLDAPVEPPEPDVDEQEPLDYEELIPSDLEAKNDFVRRCTVSLDVGRRDFLPIEPLDRFCAATPSPAECKMQLSMKLEMTYNSGGSMPQFCSAAYVWSQNKFGGGCPKQCSKMQCKASCVWLKYKGKLNARLAASDEAEEGLKEKEKALKDLEKQVTKADEKARDQERALEQAQVDLQRADKKAKESGSDLTNAQGKLKKVEDQVKKYMDMLDEAKENTTSLEDELMEAQFRYEKANLEFERRKEANSTEEGGPTADEVADMEKQVKALQDELAAQKTVTEKVGKTLEFQQKAKEEAEAKEQTVGNKASKDTKALNEAQEEQVAADKAFQAAKQAAEQIADLLGNETEALTGLGEEHLKSAQALKLEEQDLDRLKPEIVKQFNLKPEDLVS